MAKSKTESWSATESLRLYGFERWGTGYFDVSEAGHVLVRPQGRPGTPEIDLYEVIRDVRSKGASCPLIFRFPQILANQIRRLHDRFANSIEAYDYGSRYQGVFPIKVNQSKAVVEEIHQAGWKYQYGLEVGSKPELVAAISMHRNPESLLICNGYKDEEYVDMALFARRMNKKVILVVEKLTELPPIVERSRAAGVWPIIGMRCKLFARGSGRWEESSGESAKFGLNTVELLEAIDYLKAQDCLRHFQMLHFHIGSQITEIRRVKNAVKEAARTYAKTRAMGVPLTYLNVGGGLGIDYDGSKTSYDSSANYSMQEYTNDIVYTVDEVCEHEGVAPPILVSESGRAVAAFHSVFVTDVRGSTPSEPDRSLVKVAKDFPAPLKELHFIADEFSPKNFRESYHDAVQMRNDLNTMFNLGYVSLEERASGEILFREVAVKAARLAMRTKYSNEDFAPLHRYLSKKYACNFSVFQSLPDFWAVEHLFPIAPLHRLAERPSVNATLADITCDSDGKVDRFVDPRDDKDLLELHPLTEGEPYYLGFFLTGAYQDIMGDMHNLFGAPNEVTVNIDPESRAWHVRGLQESDTCGEVLEYVRYSDEFLRKRLERQLAELQEQRVIDPGQGEDMMAEYRRFLRMQTYLEGSR